MPGGAVGDQAGAALTVAVDLPRGGAVGVADQFAQAAGGVEVGAAACWAVVGLRAFGDDFVVRAFCVDQVVRFATGAAVGEQFLDSAALRVVGVFDRCAAAFDFDQAVVAVPAVARGLAGFCLFAEVAVAVVAVARGAALVVPFFGETVVLVVVVVDAVAFCA